MIQTIKPIILILFMIAMEPLSAQVPPGGIQLNASSGTTWKKIGSSSVTEIAVTGQPFFKALRAVTPASIANHYNEQIQFPAVSGITASDVVLVAFYARTITSIQETGEGSLVVVIENNTSYAKEISMKIAIGNSWKQYYAPAKCGATLSATQVTYAFQTGFPSQTIEVADVQFLNYKNTLTLNDLPVTEITYTGRDANAAWRIEARERINLHRKGMIDIVVQDKHGTPVKDALVSVEMIRHKFGFGTAIPASLFLSNSEFRKKVYEMFNEVVFENDLKWPQFNATSMTNVRRALDSLDKRNIAVRGHNVIWPSWTRCPASLQSLGSNPAALKNEINKRIDDVVTFTKGRLNDWDVINEPYSEHDIMDILGNEVMADWLKRVREIDPNVKLYINDYGILSSGGLDIKKQDSYFNLIKYLDNLGGTVDGVGMQGHFSSDLTPITKVYSILDRFAALGKDIKITEHDINITQRQVQADYTRDFMTILFSHPSVKSILIWGFWQTSHWRPDAALYNADWSIRPHGQAFRDLILNQWWTPKAEKTTSPTGAVTFEGFLGTYKCTVRAGGNETTTTFTINNSNQSRTPNSVILKMDNYSSTFINPDQYQPDFQVYPNPFKRSFTIHTEMHNETPVFAELFDTPGILVKKIRLEGNTGKTQVTINNPGIYFLKVNSVVKKLIMTN